MELPSAEEFERAINSLPDEILDPILDNMEKDIDNTTPNQEFSIVLDVEKL